MTEKHVVSALRLKRAEISGHIHDLEKRIARQRTNLANLDATVKLFSPGTNPDAIPPKRVYRRTRYFAHNELSRLTQEALRKASRPLTSAEIAAAVMQAKAIPARRLRRPGGHGTVALPPPRLIFEADLPSEIYAYRAQAT